MSQLIPCGGLNFAQGPPASEPCGDLPPAQTYKGNGSLCYLWQTEVPPFCHREGRDPFLRQPPEGCSLLLVPDAGGTRLPRVAWEAEAGRARRCRVLILPPSAELEENPLPLLSSVASLWLVWLQQGHGRCSGLGSCCGRPLAGLFGRLCTSVSF